MGFYDDILSSLELLKNNTKKAIDKAIIEYNDSQINDLRKIGRYAIDTYYKSYDPEFYTQEYRDGIFGWRQYRLYQMIDIGIKNNEVYFNFNYDDIENGEIIYNLSFIEGYHGGSYYRGPLGYWSHKTREAEKTRPINSMIQKIVYKINWQRKFDLIRDKYLYKYLG